MPVIVAPSVFVANGSSDISPTADRADLELGLLNNLSDAGLKSGEQQFVDLIKRAAGARTIRLRFFSLPQIERGARARERLDTGYGDVDDLKQAGLDGLIVTGCEPQAADLRDETFWTALTDVVDWARDNTRSTIWSCLAAHAAVLHLDGIERRRLSVKCSGVFPVERVGAHPLLAEFPERSCVPHSRYNGLDEDDLVQRGYEILTRSETAGVDAFVKQHRSLFVFLQGHPEYDRDALRREYRRDVARYHDGVSATYPRLPENYFLPRTEIALRCVAAEARRERATVPEARAVRAWQGCFATALFTNWLHHLAAEAVVCAA